MNGGTSEINATAASGPLTDLTVLTWNVWFDDLEYRRRMDHILNITLEKSPDVACFQEVLQEFADMIFKHPVVQEMYHVSPFTTGGYGVLTMVKKAYNPIFSFVDFPTIYGRELLKATFEKDQHQIVVGNVHLESLANQPTRAKQLKICAKELKNVQFPILVGDFNFCSERNFIQIPGKPLENEILTSTLPEFQDLWKLKVAYTSSSDPNPNSGDEGANSTPKKFSSSKSSALGFTFDSHVNPMIRQEERMRYDRIMAKLGNKYSFVEMEMLGTEPIDSNAVNLVNSTPVTGLWPSDHFGLIAKIRSREPLTLTVDSPQRVESQDPSHSPTSRPPNPFRSAQGSLPALKHIEGTVVTQRDGSRVIEKIDPKTGIIRHESLPAVASVCRSCGRTFGFQLESQGFQCETCKSEALLATALPEDQYLSGAEIEERLYSILTKAVALPVPVRLLAIDFDATICQVHTYGRWTGTAASLSAHTRPVFRALLRIADTFPSLRLAVVTFSGQNKLIREVLQDCLGRERAERVFIRGADRSWTPPQSTLSMEGKQPHIASVIQELYFETGELLKPEQVLLIDDDQKNIDFAKSFFHRTVTFPHLPLPGIHLRSQLEASGVQVHRRFPLLYGTLLCISEGSIVNFRGSDFGAIVNAANSGGITGGGVDGAVTMAGGEKLMQARIALPILPGSRANRIPCGDCRVTGPNKFGQLLVPTVIHAVGPNYCLLEGLTRGEGINPEDALREGDALLESAYVSSMRAAQERQIELLGFSLLSSGVFRGSRSLEEVLRIALTAVSRSVYTGLREVHLIGFTDDELSTLIEIAEGSMAPPPAPISIGPGSANAIRQFMTDLDNSLS